MNENLHHHYDQLDPSEREFADRVIRNAFADDDWDDGRPFLANDDRCERAADAIARWIIESRA